MRNQLIYVAIILLLGTFSPIRGQDHSCTALYQPLKTLQIKVSSTPSGQTDYGKNMIWYTDGQCILFHSASGLWLYDIEHPDNALRLASLTDNSINHVVVNPKDPGIAFGLDDQPIVYLIHAGGIVDTLRAEGQSVTDIAFSPDGSLIAVASSDFDEDGGFFKDARVQIWNWKTQIQVSSLPIDLKNPIFSDVLSMFFSPDNLHLLTEIAPGEHDDGYDTNRVDYWNIATQSLIWDYDDLDSKLQRSEYDPLHVEGIVMRGTTLVLDGLDTYFGPNDFKGDGIRIWDAERQTRLSEIVIDGPIALNSDGSILVVAKDKSIIQLLKISDDGKLDEFDVKATPVHQIAYSPDDRYLAVRSDDEIIIWDVAQNREYTSIVLPT